MHNAYFDYAKDAEEPKPFLEWKEEMLKYPQFLYWSTVLDLELLSLRLVRSIREGNFPMFIKSLKEIIPWMFALDHPNYARWLSVHYRGMCILPDKHPDVYAQFCNGSFVVHKNKRLFSSIALDHAHKQENAKVKGEGGAVGLTENPAALRRWMISGPEVARMIKEFENLSNQANDIRHHEQQPGVQCAFTKDVTSLIASLEEMGNPFCEEGKDLIALHTRDIMDSSVVDTVKGVKKVGKDQFNLFFQERLVERKKPITDPITRNSLRTFSPNTKKTISKEGAKIKVLKEDCALFSRL